MLSLRTKRKAREEIANVPDNYGELFTKIEEIQQNMSWMLDIHRKCNLLDNKSNIQFEMGYELGAYKLTLLSKRIERLAAKGQHRNAKAFIASVLDK